MSYSALHVVLFGNPSSLIVVLHEELNVIRMFPPAVEFPFSGLGVKIQLFFLIIETLNMGKELALQKTR